MLLGVALRSSTTVLAVVAGLVGCAMLFGGGLSGAAAAIAAGWLGVHQVPLTIGTTALSVLPLAPTVGAMYLTARSAAAATTADSSRADIIWVLAAAIGGPLAVTVVTLAVVKDASASNALAPPDTLLAFGWVVVLHGCAAAAGVLARTWRRVADGAGAPDWLPAGFGAAGAAIRRLLVAAAGVVAISLLIHWSVAVELLNTGDGFVGGLGLIVLSLGYLPNVVVGAVAVVTGTKATIGTASVDLFAVHGGPVPGLPVLSALPTGPAAAWYPLLLIIPAVVAIQLGRECAARCGSRADALGAVLTAAVVTGLAALSAGALCGGELGTFGRVGVSVGPFAGLTTIWLAALGSAAAAVATRGRSGVVVRRAVPNPAVPVVAVPAVPATPASRDDDTAASRDDETD